MQKQIRVSGFGGQGVILTAYIIGKASSLFDDKYSSLIQSFGPEARGSSCNAQLIISEQKISYPYITTSDVLIAMSQDSYSKFKPELADNGIIVYESEFVNINEPNSYGVPAISLSEKEFGKSMYANIIMVGFFTKISNVIQMQNAIDAIKTSVPEHTIQNNLKAFELGYQYAK